MLYGNLIICGTCGADFFGVFDVEDQQPMLQNVWRPSPYYGDGLATHCPICGGTVLEVGNDTVAI